MTTKPLMGPLPDSEQLAPTLPGSGNALLALVRPASRWNWVLLALPAGSALFVFGMLLSLMGGVGSADGGGVLFVLVVAIYNCLPALASTLLISWTSHYARPALPVVTVGAAISAAVTVWLLTDIAADESSTAALGLLFVPIPLGLLLVPFAAVAVTMFLIRDRRARRPSDHPVVDASRS